MNAPPLRMMAIADIKVGKRHRRELGDIDALAQNIADVGLLHPIVVTPAGATSSGPSSEAVGPALTPRLVAEIIQTMRKGRGPVLEVKTRTAKFSYQTGVTEMALNIASTDGAEPEKGRNIKLSDSTSLTPPNGAGDDGQAEDGNGHGDIPPPGSTPLTSSIVERFRLTSATMTAAARAVVTSCKIVKPKPDVFIRTHPDPMQELIVYIFEQRDGDIPMSPAAYENIRTKVEDIRKFAPCVALRPYMTRHGGVSLWPLKMESPVSVGSNGYNLTAFAVSDHTRDRWLRVSSDQAQGAYLGYPPEDVIPEPDWSKVPTVFELFEMVVKVNEITGADHPLIKPYRGKI